MSSVLYILLAFLILSVLIVLHELGHFCMGRWLGFEIEEFAIGMGPVLFRKKGKRSDFTFRAFLIGGSCRFYGEDDAVSDGKSFNAQPVWKRFLVVVAGPLMNVLTALVLAFCILLGYGTSTVGSDREHIVITSIEEGSAAEAAALAEGDVLLAVNGQAVENYDAFKSRFDAVRENGVELTVLRGASVTQTQTEQGDRTVQKSEPTGGETITVSVENIRDKRTGNNRLGVGLMLYNDEVLQRRYNVLTAAAGAFPYCWNMIVQVYDSLWQLLTGKASIGQLSGVVGTVSIMSETMKEASAVGVSTVLFVIMALGALISVNFAVVNLIPFPALDGGRLVFIVLEMLRGKPIDPEKEGVVHFVGMVLLLLLIVVLMVSDVKKLF